MPAIKSLDELKRIREEALQKKQMKATPGNIQVIVAMGTCGIAAGAREVMAALLKEIEQQGVSDVLVTTSGCAGLCSREPMATVEVRSQAPVKYVNLTPDKMVQVFRLHILGGAIVADSALAAGCETTG